MSESENKSSDHNTAGPQRKKFQLRLLIGMLLMNLGISFTTITTMNHLKRQPPEPLGFDLTLRYCDGGFIAFGVATTVLGFILLWSDSRHRIGAFGILLLNLGITFTTITTMNHLKQQPPEPLGFDLPLRDGDGGFIAYGVATAVLGFILIWMEPRHRKNA